MSSLCPPTSTRPRASSTTLRPALTINSLGRRRSNSNLQSEFASDKAVLTESPFTSDTEEYPALPTPPEPTMIAFVAHRFLQWLHLQPSATTTPEDPMLPLSASATKTSFTMSEKHLPPPPPITTASSGPSARLRAKPILLVVTLIPLSTGIVLLALNTLPISFTWPRTLTDLAKLGNELAAYSQSGRWEMWHVIAVMSISAIWKHAWSIPGSVIWNVLAGALFSPVFATLLLTFLTMCGSVCATLLSKPMSPFFSSMMPKALDMTRSALEGSSSSTSASTASTAASTPVHTPTSFHDLSSLPGTPSKSYFKPGPAPLVAEPNKTPAWVRLTILRLIGVVPWSGINIASGVCGVPIKDCMAGALIGSLPWTAVTCQIGDILQTVAATQEMSSGETPISSLLLTPANIAKLVVLSVLSLAPVLARNRLQLMLGSHTSAEPKTCREVFPAEDEMLPSPTTSSNSTREERRSSWFWNRERAEQRERDRRRVSRERELAELVQEKRIKNFDLVLPA